TSLSVYTELGSLHPSISISKIRYLEEQGLLHPQRTRGGYRLFAQEDVERLRTILRVQRGEFLPLRVVREGRGGSRVFAQTDEKRLRPLRRLPRDEFLPLRVIREELEKAAEGARQRPRR